MRDKKGDYHWFETMRQTVAGAGGKILRLQTVSCDISKRREIERERAQNDLTRMFVGEQEARSTATTTV